MRFLYEVRGGDFTSMQSFQVGMGRTMGHKHTATVEAALVHGHAFAALEKIEWPLILLILEFGILYRWTPLQFEREISSHPTQNGT